MSSKAIKRTKRAPLIQFITGLIFILIGIGSYVVPKYFLDSPASLRAQQSVFPNYKKDQPVLVEITYLSNYIATSTDDNGQEYVYYFAQVPNYDVAIIEVSKEESEKIESLELPYDFVGMPVKSSEVGLSTILNDAITHYKLEDDGPIWDNTLEYFISKVEFDRYRAPNWFIIASFGITGLIMIMGSFFSRKANKKLENQLVNQFQSVNSIQEFIDKADYRNGSLGLYIKDSIMVTSGEVYQSIDLNNVHSMGHQLMVKRGRYNYVSFIEIVSEDGRTEMIIQGKKKDIQAALPDFYKYIATNFPNIVLPDEVLAEIGYPLPSEKTTQTNKPTESIDMTPVTEEKAPVQDNTYEEYLVEPDYTLDDSENAGDDYISPFQNKSSDQE